MIERRVRIIQDSGSENPRTAWDCHAGRMICFHSRYNLGDEHSYSESAWKEELACEADAGLEEKLEELRENVEDTIADCLSSDGGMSWQDATNVANERVSARCESLIDATFDDGYVALPLTLHDHGGISMTTGYSGCSWDSSCVGFIVCTKQEVQERWGGDEDKAEEALRSDVAVYDQYLTGDVWGFVCEERDNSGCNGCGRPNDWEEVDSCWGFYGSDPETNGMKEHIDDAYHNVLSDLEVEYA